MNKGWLGVAIVAAFPVLFLLAYFIGQDKMAEPEPVPKSAVREYDPQAQEEAKAEAAVAEEEWIDLSLPSETDKQEASEVAQAFVRIFHVLDPEDPFAYIDNAKPFVTAEFFQKYEGIPKRPTLAIRSAEVKETAALPVELNAGEQVWTVEVTSEQTPELGQPELVYAEYSVLLVKEGQEWKVDGVKINER